MAMFAIQDIEDAFVTALTPLKTAGTVRTLKTLTLSPISATSKIRSNGSQLYL